MNRKTLRLCIQCEKTFWGDVGSVKCPECAKMSRSQNVVRQRICIDCGGGFEGGPRARRCPICRAVARKQYREGYRKSGPARHLGSVDICGRCGIEYVVEGSRQKYCPSCRREASLEWQREHRAEYHGLPEVVRSKKERRQQRKKVCVYCLRTYWDSTTGNVCSDYCRKKRNQFHQCRADIRRGKRRNVEALEKARDEYRQKAEKSTQT